MVVGPEAMQAWAAGDVGVDAAGIHALLRLRVDDGWFASLPPAVGKLMTNWGFDWADAPGPDEIDDSDRPNLAALATNAVRGGYLMGRMTLGTTATQYDPSVLDQLLVDHIVDLVEMMDVSLVADLGGGSLPEVAYDFIESLIAGFGDSDAYSNVAAMATDSALAYALVEFDQFV